MSYPLLVSLSFDWSSTLLISAAVNGLIALLLFWSNSRHRNTSRAWFTALVASIILLIAERVFRFSGLIDHYPGVLYATSPIFFLLPPLVYCYQRKAMGLKTQWYLHLLIPIFFLLLLLPSILQKGAEKLQVYYDNSINDPVILTIFFLLYILFYSWHIYQLNSKQAKALFDNYTDPSVVHLLFSNRVILITCLLTLIIPVSFLTQYLPFDIGQLDLISKILFVLFACSLHLILIALIRNEGKPAFQLISTPSSPSPAEFENLAGLQSELTAFMQQKKPYLNKDLSLQSLADEIGWSRTQLSAVINNGFRKNFYTYVNEYRIAAICRLFDKGEHEKYALEHLALDNGFKSYVSFYRTFKKVHGLNPKEYLLQLRKY